MSVKKFDNLPEDLQIKLIKEYGVKSIPENMQILYKKNLPKINLKTFNKNTLKSTKDILKKVQQVCNYESFDKISYENQIKKLTNLYKGDLFVTFSESNKKPYASFMGKGKVYLFKNTLIELRYFYKNNQELQNFYCKLIKCVDFDSGTKLNNPIIMMIETISKCFAYKVLTNDFINFIFNFVPKKERNDVLKSLKTFPNNRYFEKFMLGYTDKLNNNQIQDLFCNIMKFIKFENNNILTDQDRYLLEFFVLINEYIDKSIKKELFENVLLDTVRNNRAKICKYLNEVYEETITFN